MKHCNSCNRDLPESSYYKRGDGKRGLRSMCRECCYKRAMPISKYNRRQWWYKNRNGRPMNENKLCASYLGVYIAEAALRDIFDVMERMPNNNPGYDYICGRGYKIDVKSSILFTHGNGRWSFAINRNVIADYFLCLAFDSRELLNPMHIWLIPSEQINRKKNFTISLVNIGKWSEYEMPLTKLLIVKEAIKGIV